MSNILITLIFPVYLNIFTINTIRYNSERFVQENPQLSGDGQYITDDSIYDSFYTDVIISESTITGYSGRFIYNDYPLKISEDQESILLLIDLPPPVFNS
jgi:hypothetical protein